MRVTGKISRYTYCDPETLAILPAKTKKSLTFDSVAEFECYKLLRKYFPQNRVLVHHKMVILKPTNSFPTPLTWKCDFCIISDHFDTLLYIECKGQWINHNHAAKQDFLTKLRCLEATGFDLSKLLIVNTRAFWLGSLTVINFTQLETILKEIA